MHDTAGGVALGSNLPNLPYNLTSRPSVTAAWTRAYRADIIMGLLQHICTMEGERMMGGFPEAAQLPNFGGAGKSCGEMVRSTPLVNQRRLYQDL
jgi:hypothetical protein